MKTGDWRLTRHAVERYVERCQRPLTTRQARRSLEQMIPAAQYQDQVPAWANTTRLNDGCLLLGDIALVAEGRYLVTCLVRGTLPPGKRLARNRQRREHRRRKARLRGI